MVCAFTVGFLESLKSCLLLLMALPGLFDTILHSCQLEGPSMIAYDVATKVFDTESFPQDAIADISSGIIFNVLFSQEKQLRQKEINTLCQKCDVFLFSYIRNKYILVSTFSSFYSYTKIHELLKLDNKGALQIKINHSTQVFCGEY